MREDQYQERRSDYDVTDCVLVSSPVAVREAVEQIYSDLYPRVSFDPILMAFLDFERYFNGLDGEFHGVDTAYHDIQHTLDMTLAIARLIAGFERAANESERLGPDRARLGLICALFHDAGYLRHRKRDRNARNGAEFTLTHVSRSGAFLRNFLPTLGLESDAAVAAQIVHFTGYELSLDSIELDDPKDSMIGHLLGTADLIAQLADRCYLEKCRDRLFAEFVLAGIAIEEVPDGTTKIRYGSGKDLLAKTLSFYEHTARDRLDRCFNRAYRYAEAFFLGENPYVVFISKNLDYLRRVLANNSWHELRRRPACHMPNPNGETHLTALALTRIKALADKKQITLKGGRRLAPAYR